MIKYIKENSQSIFKLFINHVGMMIFGLVVLITTSLLSKKIGSPVVFYIMGVITILMYFSLIYTAMWERGAQDKIKIDGGRMKKNIFHGLFFYFIADAIAIVAGLLSFLFALFATKDASFINSLYAVFKFIAHYWNSMYLPITIIDGIPPAVHSLLYVMVVLPGALVSFVSYILGVSGFRCLFPEPKYDKNRKVR